MPSLKQARDRIKSVGATRKITSAMKMVAASKLRRAQLQAEQSRPYSDFMERLLHDLTTDVSFDMSKAPRLLTGTGKTDTRLLIVATGDRGLCGAFNSSIIRRTRLLIQLYAQEQNIKIFCIGRKGYEALSREFGDFIIDHRIGVGSPILSFAQAAEIAASLRTRFDNGEFDQCTIVYNAFETVMKQTVTEHQLIPVSLPSLEQGEENVEEAEAQASGADMETKEAPLEYEYEPSREELLEELLPKNLAVQIYRALLENAASEQGARMTAMDSATRNAGEMIKKLRLQYNRSRQAYITNELIDIIAGAQAV